MLQERLNIPQSGTKGNIQMPDAFPVDGMISEGRIFVTPQLARQILAQSNYLGQRSVSMPHVAKLASQMQNGAWMPGSQIAFGQIGDKVTLVNGQHRLTAVIEYGRPIEFQFMIVQVPDEAQLNKLYYSFDAVQRSRSAEVIMKSTGIPDALGITATVARGAYVAGGIIEMGFHAIQGVNRAPELGTPDGRMKAIEPWWSYVMVYNDILVASTERQLKRKMADAPYMAVALVTLKHQPPKARSFWAAVAANDGLRKGSPERTLVDAITGRSKGVQQEGIIAAAHCWNAYYRGSALSIIKFGSIKTLKIAGTPYPKDA